MSVLNLENISNFTLNTPIESITGMDVKVIDLINHYCYQIDHKIHMLTFFIMLMYLFDYIIFPNLKKFFPENESVFKRLNDGANSLGFMSLLYMMWISYVQIGYGFREWIAIAIFTMIIFVGIGINYFRKKENGN